MSLPFGPRLWSSAESKEGTLMGSMSGLIYLPLDRSCGARTGCNMFSGTILGICTRGVEAASRSSNRSSSSSTSLDVTFPASSRRSIPFCGRETAADTFGVTTSSGSLLDDVTASSRGGEFLPRRWLKRCCHSSLVVMGCDTARNGIGELVAGTLLRPQTSVVLEVERAVGLAFVEVLEV